MRRPSRCPATAGRPSWRRSAQPSFQTPPYQYCYVQRRAQRSGGPGRSSAEARAAVYVCTPGSSPRRSGKVAHQSNGDARGPLWVGGRMPHKPGCPEFLGPDCARTLDLIIYAQKQPPLTCCQTTNSAEQTFRRVLAAPLLITWEAGRLQCGATVNFFRQGAGSLLRRARGQHARFTQHLPPGRLGHFISL